MTSIKLAAAFAAALSLSPMAATAQNDGSTPFDPTATGTIIAQDTYGFNIRAGEPYANIQACLENMETEIADFQEMRHTDIISPGDRYTLICEDSFKRVEAIASRNLGVRRSVTFK